MDFDSKTLIWLVFGTALSVVLFLGLWVMWLKTRDDRFQKYACIFGPLPIALMLLILSLRSGNVPVAAGYFQISIDGSLAGEGEVTREILFPVADGTAPYSVEIDPVIEDVTVKAPNGQAVKASHGIIDDKRFVFFNAVGLGSYRLVIRVPSTVSKVHITSMQNR